MTALNQRQTIRADDRDRLMPALGSYWNEQYQDREVVRQLTRAAYDLSAQADLSFKTRLSLVRDLPNAPLLHRQVWWRVVLTPDLQTADHPRVWQYAPTNPLYNTTNPAYGAGLPALWTYRLPPQLVGCRAVFSQVVDPRFVGYEGHAFFHRPGTIGFRENPLFDSAFDLVETEQGLAPVIWLHQTDWDLNLLELAQGIPTQVPLKSDESSRRLALGALNARIRGPSFDSLYDVISGVTGVDLCREQQETVEFVGVQQSSLVVVTNHHTYRFPSTHTPVVVVGQQLTKGSEMTDGLRVRELARMSADTDHLLLPASFFSPDTNIKGPLLFPNTNVPLTTGPLLGGNRVFAYPVAGAPRDAVRYWIQAIAQDAARLFDKRGPAAPTPPTAANLPAQVNPMQFMKQLLGPNLTLVYGRPELWPISPAQRQDAQRILDNVMPVGGRALIQDLTLIDQLVASCTNGVPLEDGEALIDDDDLPLVFTIDTCF